VVITDSSYEFIDDELKDGAGLVRISTVMNSAPGRGRRAGSPDTRAAVLEAARRRFLADGYQGVSMRSIATEAGVDAALISYFFGSKRGLFAAVMALDANPADVLARALPGELNSLPERVLHALLSTWDDPERSASMRALITAASGDAGVARVLREVVQTEMAGRIAERIGGPDASRRAALSTVVFVGLIFDRYVLRLEPIASMHPDELVARLAPVLRAALRPPLPPQPARSPRPPGPSR
jgi:AcrR family transcriptional regulator